MPEHAWLGAGAVAMLVLLWACRGAALGTPVVDDYSFLYRLRFQHPLDPFDSMGASFYWRPLSRQVYFLLVGPWLIAAPWGAAVIHGLLLGALFLVAFALLRRGFPAPVAAAIAVFPLLGESARVLLGWPSAAQHLIAMVALAIAIHEAVAGRAITAGLASLAALLSHDAASIVLPTLPAIAWVRTRKLRPTLTWVGVSVALAGVWGIGYLVALRHGVTLPPKAHGGGLPLGEVPGILGLGLLAGLNLEDVEGVPAAFFGSLYAVTFAAAALAMLRPQSRERLKAHAWAIAGGAAWFVAGSLPLTLVLPDWNAWRASVPALGLAVALVGFAGAASPWLAGAVVVLKLVALGGAAPAPAMVSNSPPATASHMSFVRLARLQRTLDGARAALTLRHPTMPRGAVVKFWALPLLAEVGFQGPRAVRVWYGDSTITWEKFGGNEGMKRRVDVLLEFEYDHPVAAIVVEPAALELFRRGISAFEANDLRASDSLFTASAAAQPPGSDQFHGSVARNLSRVAFNLGEYQRADSLNRRDFELAGPTPAYYAMVARMAMLRNERLVAINAVRRCLMMDPNDRDGLRIARMLGMGGEGQLQR